MRISGSTVSAAANLFLVSVYAPFTISSVLSGVPLSDPAPLYAVEALIVMSIGTLLSGLLSRTALVLAPAIGMTLILQKVASAGMMSYRLTLFAAAVAGAISLLFVRVRWKGKSIRYRILTSIPDEIKTGIKGGVGALLATEAIDNFNLLTASDAPFSSGHGSNMVLSCWVIGALVLLAGDLWLHRLKTREKFGIGGRSDRYQTFLCLSATVIVGLILAYIGDIVGHWQAKAPPQVGLATLLWDSATTTLPALACSPFHDFFFALPLSILFLFIYFTDIPGTPFEMLGFQIRERTDASGPEPPEVRGSFYADATMAVVGPLLRIPPSIYYAENLILERGHEGEIRNESVAFLCASLYLSAAILLCLFTFDVDQFRAISLFAVSPILFYVGIRVVASAMLDESSGPKTSVRDAFYYLPAATAVILTPVHAIGFQLAIPISILVFAGCRLISAIEDREAATLRGDQAAGGAGDWATFAFAVASAVALLVWIGAVSSTGSERAIGQRPDTNDECSLPGLYNPPATRPRSGVRSGNHLPP